MNHSARQPPPYLIQSSLTIFCLAVLIILVSLVQLIFRLRLPSDGWSFVRDTTGTGQVMVFGRNISGLSSPLKAGDRLRSIENRPYKDILADALSSRPQPFDDWLIGKTIRYTVERDGFPITVYIKLIRLTPRQVLPNLARNLLLDPGPVFTVVVAFFVFFMRPRSQAARLLLLFSAAVFSSTSISQGISGTNLMNTGEFFNLPAFWAAQFYNAFIWPNLIAPLFLHLLLSFPIVSEPLKSHPRTTLFVLYGTMPLLTGLSAVLNIGYPLTFWATWSTLSYLDFVIVLLLAIATMARNLLSGGNPDERNQVRWIAWGTFVTSCGSLTGSVLINVGLVGPEQVLGWIATRLVLLCFPLSLAIAILRHRLFDIDFIFNRTLVYGTLTSLLAFVYFGSVLLLQTFFRKIIGETSPIAVILSTLLIAGLFTPLRHFLQEIIDKHFFRRKYNSILAIETCSAVCRTEVELDLLISRLAEIINQTLQTETVSFWLKPEPKTLSRGKNRET